jgi:HSP20 family protein
MLEEFEDLLGRLWEGREDGWFFGPGIPTLDVSETDKSVEVKVDLPGIKPKEIDIRLSGNVLTVSGERKEEQEEKGKTYHRIERRSGSFSRSVSLPCTVQEDEVAAEYRDGVLTITLPKTEAAKAHKIVVKS